MRFDALSISKLVDLHEEGLRRLRNMWLDPLVIFYQDDIPQTKSRTPFVFLAGPTSRDAIPDYMWRKDAVFFLRKHGFRGRIFVPEPRGISCLSKDGFDFSDSRKIVLWEQAGLRMSDKIIFWIPRNRGELLGLTTNRELGQWMGRAEHDKNVNKRLFIGWPEGAINMTNIQVEIEEGKLGYLEGGYYAELEELCKQIASFYEDDDIPF